MSFVPHLALVQYYETDQMGVVHHSNYIRWFEEARVFLWIKWGSVMMKWKSPAYPAGDRSQMRLSIQRALSR